MGRARASPVGGFVSAGVLLLAACGDDGDEDVFCKETTELAIPPLADFLEASSVAAPHLDEVESLDPALGPEGLGEVEGLDAEDPVAVTAVTDLVAAVAALEDEEVFSAGERVGEHINDRCGEG